MSGDRLAVVLAVVIALALNAYALTGGADFGGGVWDLLASGPRRDRQRKIIANAIGPIWEANHVWLILAVVVLFTAFPLAFAAVATVLHIPLTLLLLGIVLRGAAFVFRSYGSPDARVQRRWGRTFAIASVVSPVCLGIVIGAVASGDVGNSFTALRTGNPGFVDAFVKPWLAPFPLIVGAVTLAMFAFLAAVYLTLEADDDATRDDFRRSALRAAGVVAVMATIGLVAGYRDASHSVREMLANTWGVALALSAAAALALAAWFLARRRWAAARVAAAIPVSLVFWGWALSQAPMLVPPVLDVHQAASPDATLRLLVRVLLAGALILTPALIYLFRVFAPAGRSGAEAVPLDNPDAGSPT